MSLQPIKDESFKEERLTKGAEQTKRVKLLKMKQRKQELENIETSGGLTQSQRGELSVLREILD